MEKEIKQSAVDLTELAIGVIILGIIVTVGASIMVNVRDTHLTDLSVLSVGNETITGSNTTGTNLAKSWGKSVLFVTNSSDGTVLSSGNYTVTVGNEGTMNIKLITPEYSGVTNELNVSYDYYNTTSRADWTLANDGSVGLGEFGNWFKILVIVGIAAVILALIFMAFGNRSSSSGIGGEY